MTSNPIQELTEKVCPYLGFSYDSQTAMAYPSASNFCHKCVPSNIPTISHQREYCQVARYIECPIFISEITAPMPAEIKAEVTSRRNRKRKIIVGSLVGILLVIAALFILTQSGKGIFLSPKAPVAVQNTAVMTSIPVSATATPLPTATATEVEPTLTSTPVQPHVLETPFGVENKFVIHQLLDGESLIVLAKKYNTSVDAIKAVNQENMTLWAKTLVVIPVDQTDVSSSQRFKVILLSEKGMSIQELAVQYSVDAQLLAQVNHVPETYSFQKGEWVLIPIAQKTP